MGRNKGGRKVTYGNKKAGRDPKRAPAKSDEWQPSDPSTKTNAILEEYYAKQGIVSEEEFSAMLDILRTELPTTFRVTGSRAHAETINDLIKKTYMPTLHDVEWDGVTYAAPQQIPWYPGQLAWQLSTPKRVVRKTEPYKHFQKFLVGETEVGNLSRQEAVSMIPPLFMDVQPHHKCLDMCAAPGSKTAQIIEALNPHDERSTGFLIANDSDYKRTHMLVHQTGRMPSRGLMVTNLDAAWIPNIELGGGRKLLFDRILADVPAWELIVSCSGDGTLRKNVEIWRKWTANDGNSLHSLQLRILDRAMRLLKPGGRLVYSTCSFNPAENESVVAAGLNLHPGQFKLVDVSDHLPELKRRPGMLSWKVATQAPASRDSEKSIVWHDTYAEYERKVDEASAETERPEKEKKKLPSSLWPPANAEELHLERCMRLVPHDQNTGGFFVCVLEKSSDAPEDEPETELPPVPSLEDVNVADEKGAQSLKREASPSGVEGAEPESKRAKQGDDGEDQESPAVEKEEKEDNKAGPSKPKKVKKDWTFKEDPYSFVDPNHEEIQSIVDWFKLDDKFQRDKLMVRNDAGAPLRTLYIVNETVKAVLQNNDYTRMRIISAGVKSFVRQDSSKRGDIICKWRVPGEGMIEVIPHLPEGVIIDASIAELKVMISEMYPPIERFDPSVQGWMRDLKLGNAIIRIRAGEEAGGSLPLPLILPAWKANTSVSLLIDKREKATLSHRVFGKDFTPGPANGPQGYKTETMATEPASTEGGEAGAVAVGEEAAVAVEGDEESAMNT